MPDTTLEHSFVHDDVHVAGIVVDERLPRWPTKGGRRFLSLTFLRACGGRTQGAFTSIRENFFDEGTGQGKGIVCRSPRRLLTSGPDGSSRTNNGVRFRVLRRLLLPIPCPVDLVHPTLNLGSKYIEAFRRRAPRRCYADAAISASARTHPAWPSSRPS
jgi:hypothetical protein